MIPIRGHARYGQAQLQTKVKVWLMPYQTQWHHLPLKERVRLLQAAARATGIRRVTFFH